MNGINSTFLHDIVRGRHVGGGGEGTTSRGVGTELKLEFILDHTDGLRRVGLSEGARGSAQTLDEYLRALAVRYLDNARTFALALRGLFLTVFPKRDILRDSCLTLGGGSQLPL